MLESGFTSVLKTRNRDEFQNEVVGFTKRLGFETVSAMVVIDHLLGEAEFITVDNTPRGFREIFEDPNKQRRDPVMQLSEDVVHDTLQRRRNVGSAGPLWLLRRDRHGPAPS